jgi:hypothetical protein
MLATMPFLRFLCKQTNAATGPDACADEDDNLYYTRKRRVCQMLFVELREIGAFLCIASVRCRKAPFFAQNCQKNIKIQKKFTIRKAVFSHKGLLFCKINGIITWFCGILHLREKICVSK